MGPPTPRIFLVRHGETEWSLNGRHTGATDIPLTSNGVSRIQATGRALVGRDRLIVPGNLAKVIVSPMTRARRTLELLVEAGLCDEEEGGACTEGFGAERVADWIQKGKVEVRDDIREWNYGKYEGVTSKEIQKQWEDAGWTRKWDIWRDGCPGGESPEQVGARLDALIKELRDRFHGPALEAAKKNPNHPPGPCDILIVAHGHILRAFAARWIGTRLGDNPSMLLEAGGVGTLSYEHHSLEEPAIMLGGAFVVEGS